MVTLRALLVENRPYQGFSLMALACAVVFARITETGPLPGIGNLPLTALTLGAALTGGLLLAGLQRRGLCPKAADAPTGRLFLRLLGLGALLALPPIGIDLWLRFPADINVALPRALVFYPAVALVAEVLFHLLPLALLAALAPKGTPTNWLFLPAIFVEPLFQIAFMPRFDLMALLVLGNVSLVSAAQLWLFRRHGFAAMITLRLTFYLFWHLIWGSLRLLLLF